jgi:hypothetical protein
VTRHGRCRWGRRCGADGTAARPWLAWDLADEWFTDFSITRNTVEPIVRHRWETEGEPPFRIAWRDDADPEPAALRGREPRAAELVESGNPDPACRVHPLPPR